MRVAHASGFVLREPWFFMKTQPQTSPTLRLGGKMQLQKVVIPLIKGSMLF
jgi:hypothetical protein